MITFKDRILKNPRLLKLKNPTTEEIINFEVQDYTEDEIEQEGTEVNSITLNQAFLDTHPVGSLYLSLDETDPADLFGGTWKLIGKDLCLIGAGNKYTAGNTVGNETVTLLTKNLPAHTHKIPQLSGATNSTGTHNHIGRYAQYGTTGGSKLVLRRISNEDEYKGTDTAVEGNGGHSHTITTNESTTGSTGSGTAFNITPKSLAVYIWNRTA